MNSLITIIKALKPRRLLFSAIGAVFLNFWLWAGFYIDQYHTAFYIGGHSLFRFFCWTMTFLLFCMALYLLFVLFDRGAIPVVRPAATRRTFWICFVLFLAVWSIYLWIFHPGVVTEDTYVQINQGLGFTELKDHHPFIHTLIIGLFVRIGRSIFGTIASGIIVYTIFQMIVLAFIASASVFYLFRKGLHPLAVWGIFAFYLLHPMIGTYSVTIWKDIWLGWLTLVLVLCVIGMIEEEEQFFASRKRMGFLIAVAAATEFSKKSGLYIVAVVLLFTIILFGKKRIKQTVLIFLIAVGGYLILHSALMSALGVQKGQVKEALSVPMQQVARTVAKLDERDGITKEEKAVISELLPYDQLAERYDPHISDPVKVKFDTDAFNSDRMKYLKFWFELGVKHPSIYIDSFLEGTYGYWFPDVSYWQISNRSYLWRVLKLKEDGEKIYDPDADSYVPDQARENNVERFRNEYNELREVPGVSVFFRIAYYFWAAFAALVYCLYSRKWKWLLPCIAMAMVFVTCVISPVYAECRYAFPVFLCVPVIWAFLLRKKAETGQPAEKAE